MEENGGSSATFALICSWEESFYQNMTKVYDFYPFNHSVNDDHNIPDTPKSLIYKSKECIISKVNL